MLSSFGACSTDTPAASRYVRDSQVRDGQVGASDAARGSDAVVLVDGSNVCEPTGCDAQDAECGEVPDGCGGTLNCGACPSDQTCGGGGVNRCGAAPCEPRTCQQLGATCGQHSDGCGATLQCGECIGGRCESLQCVYPAHHGTTRSQLAYVVMAHPDDELGGWAIVERSTANYSVIIHGTRGEATAYCKNDFPGYQPELGEAPPGNMADYKNRTCKELRIGSSRAFWGAVANFDSAFRPTPSEHHARTGVALPSGAPGQGCAVSSSAFDMWVGQNGALVFFDMGDGDLKECEVQWMISQVRQLRGTELLPNLPEYSVVAIGAYNDADHDPKTVDPQYANCAHYGHPDHYAVHRGVFHTDYGTAGPQLGRSCSADPDVPSARRNIVVDDYAKIMGVAGDGTRTGAAQIYYGWLTSVWPTGTEAQTLSPNAQSFWQVH